MSLFIDDDADALSVAVAEGAGANREMTITFSFVYVVTDLVVHTFKIRAGTPGAKAVYFNGASGARIFGGVSASSLTATEVGHQL